MRKAQSVPATPASVVGLECSDRELRSESTGDDQRRADQSERDEWPGPWRRRMFRFEF
jgi:hypothetical protein